MQRSIDASFFHQSDAEDDVDVSSFKSGVCHGRTRLPFASSSSLLSLDLVAIAIEMHLFFLFVFLFS